MSKATSRGVTADRVDGEQLAQLDEEMRARIQMQDIESSTVAPGKIMVDVKAVATSEENEKINIRVEHPIDGEISFYLDKPRTWNPDNELVQFLEWYDLNINGIYTLQTHEVCIEKEDSTKGWRLCRPPSYEKSMSRRQRIREWLPPKPDPEERVVLGGLVIILLASQTVTSAVAHYGNPDPHLPIASFLLGLMMTAMTIMVVVGFLGASSEVFEDV